MDKELLVGQIQLLINEFAKKNKNVAFAGLVNAYPQFESTPFTLVLSCPWMASYGNCYSKTEEVVTMMYKHLSPDAIRRIHAVDVFDTVEEAQLYIKNECRMEDSSCSRQINIAQNANEEANAALAHA